MQPSSAQSESVLPELHKCLTSILSVKIARLYLELTLNPNCNGDDISLSPAICVNASSNYFTNDVKFYGSFNNILNVLGKIRNDMLAVHLIETYCLPILLYSCEIWGPDQSI